MADIVAQARDRATEQNAGAIQQTPRVKTIPEMIQRYAERITGELPASANPAKFLAGVTTAIQKSPALLECTNDSLLTAVLMCAGFGMVPNTPLQHCFILPYNERQRDGSFVKKAQFQLGYQGTLALLYASDELSSASANVVYEGDEFYYEYGLTPVLRHVPCGESNPDKITHAYAVFTMRSGGRPEFEVMRRSEIDAIRKRSKSADKGPWVTDYPMMARKTALIRGSRYLKKGDLLARAAQYEHEPLNADPVQQADDPSLAQANEVLVITEGTGG